ncbi:GGDEF domain-containing protein [Noviherbaspirillum autotrophicum]|uniref:GGDEF domain-containing protein n=1 Tax=Noviherbaspirillum autotrophicum TaxID=709839 RepID=UPI0006943391|nr:sensor domain-containing diguanylate cyclase [Noviherbaspirillum autotrophicum]
MRAEIIKKLGGMLLALSAITATGYLSYCLSRNAEMRALHEKAERRLVMSSATLFAPINKYSYLPALVALQPQIIDALQHQDDKQRLRLANIFLDRINDSAKSAATYILNDKGVVIAANNWQQPTSFVGQNYTFRPYFQDALRDGSGQFYGVGVTSLAPGFFLSHAVRDSDKVLGVAVVKVDLSDLDAGWDSTRLGGEFFVTDEHGVIFLSSRADWKYRPLAPLSAATREQVRRTRQYDAVLKEPLPITTLAQLQPNEALADIAQNDGANGRRQARYLIKRAPLAGSDWAVNVLIPAADANLRAVSTGVAGAGALAFFMLAVMYVRQARHRTREREKSRQELERTHKALEQQHRELQTLTEELRITAITDPLTGAYNRRFFFETAGKLVSAVHRHQSALSIVTIDVDHFKRINDLYGHPAGDQVLRKLTEICKETLRETDVFARFGGEEFIMALPNSDSTAACAAAERLRTTMMEQTIVVSDTPLRITLSCGVSQFRAQEASIDETLKRADEALYEAKNSGRNRVVLR